MRRKAIPSLFSVLLCLAFTLNTSITAFAATNADEVSISAEERAAALLKSAYEELSFDEDTIAQLSRSSIPAELYIYVDATLLPFFTSPNDSLTITMNYNSSNYSYWTHSDKSIVTSYSVYDTVTAPSVNTFTGTFSLSATPPTTYTGVITAIRLRASVIGNSLHSYTAPTPVISSLLIGSSDFTSVASNFIHTTSRIPGDVNCDGYVNDSDTNLLAHFLAEDPSANITAAGKISADVDRSGNIDYNDLTIILQVLAGNINHF